MTNGVSLILKQHSVTRITHACVPGLTRFKPKFAIVGLPYNCGNAKIDDHLSSEQDKVCLLPAYPRAAPAIRLSTLEGGPLHISDSVPRQFPAADMPQRATASSKRRGAWVLSVAVLALIVGGAGRLDGQTAAANTVSILSASGTQSYQLTCAVNGPALSGIAGIAGTVSFTDVTAGQTLGTAPLSSMIGGDSVGAPQLFPAGDEPVSIATGDFNGDGKLDVAFGGADGSISLLLGNGDGTFLAPKSLSTPATLSFSMAAGDFNGDGKLDLAVADWHSNNIYVLLGNGDGTFKAPVSAVNSAGWYGEMISADVNGDGKPDLVITDFNSSQLSVLLGNGDGTFQTALITQTTTDPGGVAAGDFNRDGKLDLVVTGSAEVSILPGNGDGTFGTAISYPIVLGEAPEGIALADFNGDGKTDIALTSIAGTFVLLGNGDDTFQKPAAVSTTYPASYILAADFNGDGITDLVISGYEAGDVEVFLGQGNGAFQWFESLADGGDEPGPLASLKFSGEELPSLVIGNILSSNASVVPNNTVTATGVLSGVVLPAQAPASHNVQCSYSGDANDAGSISNQVTLIAEPAATPVYSPGTGSYDSLQTVSITDSMSGAAIYYTTDGSTPTASSTFYTGPLGIANAGTLNAIAYAAGYLPSNVATATYTFTPGYSLTAEPILQTVGRGQPAVFTLTVTPVGGFSSAVNFSCAGLPTGASCAFSPASVTPSGGPATTALSISTAGIAASRLPRPGPEMPNGTGGALTLAGILGVIFIRRRKQLWRLSCVLILAGAAALTSCGGGSGGSHAMTYVVKVSSATTNGPSRTVQLTLTVE
jgi:hypothetical protein